MAANEDSGERSEEPTEKRKREAREKGEVARSKELNSAALLIASGLIFTVAGGYATSGIASTLMENFIIDRATIFDPKFMLQSLGHSINNSFMFLVPIFIVFYLTALIAPVSIGGLNFSTKAIAFKPNRMSPMKGFKKMFGVTALMELIKSIAKFAVVASFTIFYLKGRFGEFMTLGHGDTLSEITRGLGLLVNSFLVIALSLLMIVAIDVPFQVWNHARKQKMTKKEVRDEAKDAEGKPEVKRRLRQSQFELSNRRMMEEVPKADVVITNPEHFAVALKYSENMVAPVVVAKGVEEVALHIRKIAKHNEVPMFAAPPLARAIFYSTKINHPIPEGLYLAVAQVLAYVFQLKDFRKGKGNRPSDVTDLDIPNELKR